MGPQPYGAITKTCGVSKALTLLPANPRRPCIRGGQGTDLKKKVLNSKNAAGAAAADTEAAAKLPHARGHTLIRVHTGTELTEFKRAGRFACLYTSRHVHRHVIVPVLGIADDPSGSGAYLS